MHVFRYPWVRLSVTGVILIGIMGYASGLTQSDEAPEAVSDAWQELQHIWFYPLEYGLSIVLGEDAESVWGEWGKESADAYWALVLISSTAPYYPGAGYLVQGWHQWVIDGLRGLPMVYRQISDRQWSISTIFHDFGILILYSFRYFSPACPQGP